MRILYVAAEVEPFIKTGGLADVAGSLPRALKDLDQDVSVVMPLYSAIDDSYRRKMKRIGEFSVRLGWRSQYAGILTLEENGVTHYFIDNEYYFKRWGVYGHGDDGERFIFFAKAVVQMIKELNLKVDIVHANDWHSGLIPLYIKDFGRGDEFYRRIKTVFTIHNLKYQGIFDHRILDSIGGLSMDYYQDGGLKYYDGINFMKAGIVYSDAFTTVSKTYAEEIKSEFFGEGLEGIIRSNDYKLKGIVNGIDYKLFNPQRDINIESNYSFKTIEKKKKNKEALQRLYGLPTRDVPLLAMVSRLVAMKGLDLVRHIMDELLQEDVQLIILGTGDREYEDSFRAFQAKYPDKMAARIYFNSKEAQLIYAGADIFLMPSMAEPCGISQLISLRYGTIPVVRETGGLKDTVQAYNKYTGEGNGFSFMNFNAHELLFTIKSALELYKDQDAWLKLVGQAMDSKNDWEESSKEYLDLYENIIN